MGMGQGVVCRSKTGIFAQVLYLLFIARQTGIVAQLDREYGYLRGVDGSRYGTPLDVDVVPKLIKPGVHEEPKGVRIRAGGIDTLRLHV